MHVPRHSQFHLPRRHALVVGAAALAGWGFPWGLLGSEPTPAFKAVDPDEPRIPQTLLGIVHSTEGQRELGLVRQDREGFEAFLRKVDGDWMRARSQSLPARRRVVAQCETAVLEEVSRRLGARAHARLRQLELQAQGLRAVLRPEIASHLEITPDLLSRIEARIARTDAAEAEARRTRTGKPDERDQAEAADAEWRRLRDSEGREVAAELTATQRSRLATAAGPRIDTNRFQRVHPLVPELIDTGHWLRDRRVRLSDLRGKVVLVHFYAFECRNCRANFATYNRWNSVLGKRGVEIVGIQSPETAAERDPARVLAAAQTDGFEYPVLVDPKRENWDAWGVDSWPTIHLIDRRGYLRHWWVGELTWPGTRGDTIVERLVDSLLAESAA